MTVSALKSSITTKTIPHILVFTGDEWKVQQIYIQQIAKIFNLPIARLDSAAEVLSKVNKTSLLRTAYLYVVSNDKEYINEEQLQNAIRKEIGENYLVLQYTSVDKRIKFFKEADYIEFEVLPEDQLIKYIKKEIDLSDKNCKKLIEVCEGNYGRCLLEIDKIKSYAQGFVGNYGYDNFFQMLLEDGTIYQPPKDAIFDFVDAVLNRDLQVFDLLKQSFAVGEAVLVMLSVLYTNTRALYQVQTCKSNDISKATGLTTWQISNAKKHLNVYTDEDLLYLLSVIRKCEKGIKTGVIDEQFVMDYILVQIL